MDIIIIRWLNARLLFKFNNENIKKCATIMDRDRVLISKWCNAKELKKPIGPNIARRMEEKFASTILIQANANKSSYWMDEPHYDLWRNIIGETLHGKDDHAVHYPAQAIYEAITFVMEQCLEQDLEITDPHLFAERCLQATALYSENQEQQIEALDGITDEINAKTKNVKHKALKNKDENKFTRVIQ